MSGRRAGSGAPAAARSPLAAVRAGRWVRVAHPGPAGARGGGGLGGRAAGSLKKGELPALDELRAIFKASAAGAAAAPASPREQRRSRGEGKPRQLPAHPPAASRRESRSAGGGGEPSARPPRLPGLRGHCGARHGEPEAVITAVLQAALPMPGSLVC